MTETKLTADMTIAEIQEQWPQTIQVFREHAAACVGCDLAPFCTVAEAAKEYRLELQQLLGDLQESIKN